MVIARFKDLCIDAGDAGRVADFRGAVLGLRITRQAGSDAVLTGATPAETIWVNTVPEPKTAKHRVHLDLAAAARDPLVELGASVVLPAEESGFPWTLMADPDGNEFCVFPPS